MTDRWILTPQYFETHEPALASVCPDTAVLNGPHPIPDREEDSMATLHRPIAGFVQTAIRDGVRPVSVAGDCCASVPVLAGMLAGGVRPTLVWLDAHGDFNTPETSPSQFLGGMPLAMMVGRGPQWMCEAVGLAPFAEERIWAIDLRDLDPLERAALDASAVRRTGMAGLATLKIDGPVLVHIDMDVMNAREVGAFNYPVPGGPSVAETVAACGAFAAANQVAALSVSGWTGSLDKDGRTGAACGQVIDAILS
ncbi:MAG: arginase family protein [Pseudomonadota bacterium]